MDKQENKIMDLFEKYMPRILAFQLTSALFLNLINYQDKRTAEREFEKGRVYEREIHLNERTQQIGGGNEMLRDNYHWMSQGILKIVQ